MDEKTCRSCFWHQERNEVHGYCRNPRLAQVTYASTYSGGSEKVIAPRSVAFHQVCDLHEVADPVEVRSVFEVRQSPSFRYGSNRSEWERVD